MLAFLRLFVRVIFETTFQPARLPRYVCSHSQFWALFHQARKVAGPATVWCVCQTAFDLLTHLWKTESQQLLQSERKLRLEGGQQSGRPQNAEPLPSLIKNTGVVNELRWKQNKKTCCRINVLSLCMDVKTALTGRSAKNRHLKQNHRKIENFDPLFLVHFYQNQVNIEGFILQCASFGCWLVL